METLLTDLRFAVRVLRKAPGFTFAAVLTLALGIGATSTMFSMANAVLLRPFPFAEPDRLLRLSQDDRSRGATEVSVTFPTYATWRAEAKTLSDVAAYTASIVTLRAQGEAERFDGARVTFNTFRTLGVAPVLGRAFVESEDAPGGATAVIIGYDVWQSRFGGDPGVIGRSVHVDGAPRTIVGVMDRGFRFPGTAEVWVPLAENPLGAQGDHYLDVIARLRNGATVDMARAEIAGISSRLAARVPEERSFAPRVDGFRRATVASLRPMVYVQLGAVAFVLLIACANVANLMLARAATRSREIAIRAAIGAGRGRVIRQLLTESLMIALAGGLLGIVLAGWSIDLLLSMVPVALPYWLDIDIDTRVALFTAALSCVTAVLFGLAPALQSTRADVHSTLRETRSTGGVSHGRMRSTLVVGQLCLALVLLVGGLLMVRSLIAMRSVDPGFDVDRLVKMDIEAPPVRYDRARVRTFYREVVARVNGLPGVAGAALVSDFPISGENSRSNFTIAGRPVPERGHGHAEHKRVSPEYFNVMRIGLLRGRAFTQQDDENAPRVAIVNQTFARQFFPGEDPIGKQVRWGGAADDVKAEEWFTIVGVAHDVHQSDVNQKTIPPDIYRPLAQEPRNAVALAVRTRGNVEDVVRGVRTELRAIDPDIALANVLTGRAVLEQATWDARFFSSIFSAFGALALVLAGIGLYGVIAYAVAQRRKEIGIRMALGARAGDVQRMVVGQGLRLAVFGVSIGLVLAFAVARVLSSALYGVSATDPVTFVIVPVVLTGVAVLASFVPARRAARVDPASVLNAQ